MTRTLLPGTLLFLKDPELWHSRAAWPGSTGQRVGRSQTANQMTKMKQNKTRLFIAITLLSLWAGVAAGTPLGTAFTYQGRLTDGGPVANGTYELRLAVWDALTAGSQVASATNT